MLKLLIFGLYLIFSEMYVDGAQIGRRNAAYCAYLSRRIMCYGGSPNDNGYDTSVNYLDLSQQNGNDVANLENEWDVQHPPTDGFEIASEPRYDSQYTALPDGFRMLIQGGSNELPTAIVNQTVVYNTLTNAWSQLPNFEDAKNGGVRQIFGGTAVYASSTNSVVYYGGTQMQVAKNYTYIKRDNTTFPSNFTYNSYGSSFENYVGFYYLTTFDLISNKWEVPDQSNFPYLPSYHTATYHESSDTIFYLGGRQYNQAVGDYTTVPLSWCLTYQVASAKWGNLTLTGAQIPSPRLLHTATLLTSTKNDILLFGGAPMAENNNPVDDYCYTLNIVERVWTWHPLQANNGSIGPRFYHNAVLVDDSSLFILFGKTASNSTTNDVSVLDVRNVSAIQFSNQFPLAEDVVVLNNTVTEETNISTGAIAGIIVGSVAVFIGLCTFGILLIKKRRAKRREAQEVLEVDWDQIETQFQELPPTAITSPTSTMVGTQTQVPDASYTQDNIEKSIILSVFRPRPTSIASVVKPDYGQEMKKNE